MAAFHQLSMMKDVFILSSERDNFDRHGQSYVGKLKYSGNPRASIVTNNYATKLIPAN